uniref:Metallo-beta-lactamase domain-containing protein n=1 Tax=Meloidogyne javanica TaxID=6303 RepID=A0A915LDQ6_MELJA
MTDEINLKWLSWNAHRPCILLKFDHLHVLLDCIVGMDSLTSFLPCPLVRSNRISWQKKVHPYGKDVIPILKQINDLVYVELTPEMRTVKFKDIDPSSLDAILISNSSSFIALPFITEGTGFKDLCDIFEQIDRPLIDEWAWKNISNSFPNPPNSDPNYWKSFYKRIDIENCMKRVKLLFFRQEIALSEDLRITPYSSGHSIGSCNWLLSTNQHKIGYFAASSLRPSHPKPMELNSFNNLDALILTSIHTNDQSPDITVYKFTSAVVETLKIGGNVLIPVISTGLIYDLFEIIVKAIEV